MYDRLALDSTAIGFIYGRGPFYQVRWDRLMFPRLEKNKVNILGSGGVNVEPE